MYRYAPCRLSICNDRWRIGTHTLNNRLFSSYATCRYMAVAMRPLPLQMRRRQGAYRYRPSTVLTHIGANFGVCEPPCATYGWGGPSVWFVHVAYRYRGCPPCVFTLLSLFCRVFFTQDMLVNKTNQ
jgi:hypothetical protein